MQKGQLILVAGRFLHVFGPRRAKFKNFRSNNGNHSDGLIFSDHAGFWYLKIISHAANLQAICAAMGLPDVWKRKPTETEHLRKQTHPVGEGVLHREKLFSNAGSQPAVCALQFLWGSACQR